MPRFVRPATAAKSERLIRALVNEHPQILNEALSVQFANPRFNRAKWLSPLATDNFAEYSDQTFINLLEVNLASRPLATFWPTGGPHWDALGRTEDGAVVLVEAKAYIEEIVTDPTRAKNESSIDLIRRSLADTHEYLGGNQDADWSGIFYQYSNRLAHLYLLRKLNGIAAYLAFVYFVNATDVPEPSTEAEWKAALRVVHGYLGVGRHKLAPNVAECFVDEQSLTASATE